MRREDFENLYSTKAYLGDGLYVHFDGCHFVLSTRRGDEIHWVALELSVFETLLQYRTQVYEDAKHIID